MLNSQQSDVVSGGW